MKQLLAILRKEVRDNFRDKRSMFFSLLYGPVLMPLMIFAPLMIMMNRYSIDNDRVMTIEVSGSENAPNLLAFLHQNNIDYKEAAEDYKEKVKKDLVDVVLEIPSDYPTHFRAGEPAALYLHYDSENSASQKTFRQLKTVLDKFNALLKSERFAVRGIDENIFKPLDIVERNASTVSQKAKFTNGFLPFLFLFPLLMGGFYLAIDTTAGERERLSFEPLLSLAVPRSVLVFAKWLSVCLFVNLSFFLTIVGTCVAQLLASKDFDMILSLSFPVLAKLVLTMWPLTLLMSAFLFTVAAIARNTKEAQSQMGFAMMLPMAPYFVLQFAELKPSYETMAIPVLGQFQLVQDLVAGEALNIGYLLISAGSAILLTLILLVVSINSYRKEKMLT